MTTTLIVLAATMGNKYGGLKQLEGIGPNGETILDYSIYDAIKVGFNKVIFVISRYFEEDFKTKVSKKYEDLIEIDYVFQEVEIVAAEQRNPKRTLLWGSAHALLMCESIVRGPFGVINAVNFYQRESFELLYNYLQKAKDAQYQYFMISFRLANVLAESGGVTRGICEIDENNQLKSVVDQSGIERVGGDSMFLNEYNKWIRLDEKTFVSMNMWGFTDKIFKDLKIAFENFIAVHGNDVKAHYSIPNFINSIIATGTTVASIETKAQWMGLVSPDDRIQMILRINELIRKGIYPNKLFERPYVENKQ